MLTKYRLIFSILSRNLLNSLSVYFPATIAIVTVSGFKNISLQPLSRSTTNAKYLAKPFKMMGPSVQTLLLAAGFRPSQI